MALRPETAHWFECLVAREDLPASLEILAASGEIQLSAEPAMQEHESLTDLGELLEEFHQLAARYHPYWPPAIAPANVAGKPARTLQTALRTLRDWAGTSDARILELERLQAEDADLDRLREWLHALPQQTLDLGWLVNVGPLLSVQLYRVHEQGELSEPPPPWLCWTLARPAGQDQGPLQAATGYRLLIGPAAQNEDLAHELSAQRVRRIPLPAWLHGTPRAAAAQVEAQLEMDARRIVLLQRELHDSWEAYKLGERLGEIARLDWFLRQGRYQVNSDNLAWIRGWSSAHDAAGLQARLAGAGVRALVQFSLPPAGHAPPLVLRNPRWARPFELFTRLLGMPSAEEADPSRILALVVPLLFGYMFGDVGQGLVLLLAGLWLRRRWPASSLLIPAGASAMLFGLLFGSVFTREDLIPALWLHPMDQPLLVLAVPLVFGVLLLLLGLLLNGLEAAWRNAARHWWWCEAPVVLLYLGLLGLLLHPGAVHALWLGLGWALLGGLVTGQGHPAARLGLALGALFEQLFQLAVNSLSFSRVGAFALAHAGLSQAVVALAGLAGHGGWMVLVLGNLFILALEGLVVSIQTTRLVLFEFFIRFLRAEGLGFRPLPAPDYPAFTITRSSS
ncbi:MAG: ATPase [Gammaproteobacteria bacterium]|nr:ATPase [Gammaproteobacteria bacterium]